AAPRIIGRKPDGPEAPAREVRPSREVSRRAGSPGRRAAGLVPAVRPARPGSSPPPRAPCAPCRLPVVAPAARGPALTSTTHLTSLFHVSCTGEGRSVDLLMWAQAAHPQGCRGKIRAYRPRPTAEPPAETELRENRGAAASCRRGQVSRGDSAHGLVQGA